MFALIADGQLYLKVDEKSRGAFEVAGLSPFVYEAKGRRVALSYYRAPDAMLDEPDVAREWAERGWRGFAGALAQKGQGRGFASPCASRQRPISASLVGGLHG